MRVTNPFTEQGKFWSRTSMVSVTRRALIFVGLCAPLIIATIPPPKLLDGQHITAYVHLSVLSHPRPLLLPSLLLSPVIIIPAFILLLSPACPHPALTLLKPSSCFHSPSCSRAAVLTLLLSFTLLRSRCCAHPPAFIFLFSLLSCAHHPTLTLSRPPLALQRAACV